MNIQFVGLPSHQVAQTKTRGLDAYDNPIETHCSDGEAYPCRHCLGETPAGEDYLILAWRPFETSNPYAETGPIFLCAADCKAMAPSDKVPTILVSPSYLVRGYSKDERIVYGTGQVVQTSKIAAYARELLADPTIAFVDVRSASNNCFQCRIERT
ncbi:DUF1203 domain-containing protein [Roseovarius phycicola]|uniref:DUF1203 domain-containing protein n=1 Tax=Roseovarius phycicola TaxID=3080976 RepID=A0ABZ2HMG2_9RHOB